jgi:hypothetical protein
VAPVGEELARNADPRGDQNVSQIEDFRRDGYIYLPGLFADAAPALRWYLMQASGLAEYSPENPWATPDAMNRLPGLRHLLFEPRVLRVVRQVLATEDIRFAQHADAHVHRAERRFHRDSVHRTFGRGSDWDESEAPYRLVRVALYLQSHAESGFSFELIPGSHRERVVEERRSHRVGPGDCFVFDPRVVHRSSSFCGPKFGVFWAYGADNRHSRNHRAYYLHDRRDLDYSPYDAELESHLRQAGLWLEAGSPEQGGWVHSEKMY